MLLGEGSVFLLLLLGGILLIRKALKKERELAKKEENFALSITHELKTPISSVQLFLQTLKKRNLPEEKRLDIYEQSLEEVNRLDHLVNNILMTRSIENDNYYLNKEKIELSSLIEAKLITLEKTILKNHIIEKELAVCTLLMDKVAFESIFVNIIENASKYSPKGSVIRVDLRNESNYVSLTISDQGQGIQANKKAEVFSKYYREENEMTRKSKGTGLGLYITKYLVKKHDGKISLIPNTPFGLIVKIDFKK
jgi:K+-sensing histidine kinase KdpD